MVMDWLRYWVGDMQVDGFRFDLAVSLAPGRPSFLPARPLPRRDRAGSAARKAKLIAEPWDLGPDGYQLGGFRPGWSEWNDRCRDGVRRFWRGEGNVVGDLAFRLSGSSDVFGQSGRGPSASINFITAHDGFTLEDLVSYETSTTWTTVKETPTAQMRIIAGIAASKARTPIAQSWPFANSRSAT